MAADGPERLRVEVQGAVQGVGFRPFVYRLARDLDLNGWVLNDNRGVFMELEGSRRELESFLERLPREKPRLADLHRVEPSWWSPVGFSDLVIRESDDDGSKSVVVLPEVATCIDCLREVLDPDDRRYRYPFTNCTNCGPRFSIVRSLPYDRPRTSMSEFLMCDRCRQEYDDPGDRRFHAQPNACRDCGPRLRLEDSDGRSLGEHDAALQLAAEALRAGSILAAKGLGGFHLMADAGNAAAVHDLRARKHRDAKPLALMARDLEQARTICEISGEAAALLSSAAAPIVLLPRHPDAPVAELVAPGNPYLGVMLPYTPLHHLLMRDVGRPLVATSGNLSQEPICIENQDAIARLGSVADLFLLHDRPIVRHVDDSVMREQDGSFQPVRRARGFAPLPIPVERELPPILAIGAHLKNTVAVSVGRNVFMSQHIGDMETPQAMEAFERVIRDFSSLYGIEPTLVAHDLHPDYPTTRWLNRIRGASGSTDVWRWLRSAKTLAVQHHHAHLASCLADNSVEGPALGVTWDGTGYGPDGTVWGGELLLGDAAGYERVARIRPFPLPGGEAAILEPRRTALALLWTVFGSEALEYDDLAAIASFNTTERGLLDRMLLRGINSPSTSSCGRLFDGVAALAGLSQRVSFEGEAAMALEFIADVTVTDAYPIEISLSDATGRYAPRFELDWAPLVAGVVDDVRRGIDAGAVAARFHNALANAAVAIAVEADVATVALTGGCFQNRLLTTRITDSLEDAGFTVLRHRRVPPNDGSICLGQVVVAAASVGARARQEGS